MVRPEVERTPASYGEGSSNSHDAVVVRDQTQTSHRFLESAADFEIHDGSIASIGGDSFTARRDVHVTINHIHASSSPSSSTSTSSLNIPNETRDQERGYEEMYSTPSRRGILSERTLVLPPLPVQRSCDIYRRHLASKGRGIPLWIPEPSKNLPLQYQRQGISIGDVGIVTASGSFTFLFNICLPSDHPINPPIMPEGFEMLRLERVNVSVQEEFKENSYLASASSVRSRRDGESTGLIFESSEQDGAILTMPVGSKSEDLGSIARFRKYVTANMVGWYRYAYHVREFEVRNGDLRVVTGSDKTSAWGMATFFNSNLGSQESDPSSTDSKFHLEFGLIENGNEAEGRGTPRGRRYGWEYSGVAEVRAGPDAREVRALRGEDESEEGVVSYENQCLFVRTLNATLPEKVWEELGFDEDEGNVDLGYGYGSYSMNGNAGSSASFGERGSAGGRGEGGGSSSTSLPSGHRTAGSSLSTTIATRRKDSIATDYDKASVYSSLISLPDHPSVAINELLLKNCSEEATMAVTLDQDWMSVLREDDFVLPSSEEMLERIMASFVIREEEGIVFLDSKCQDETSEWPSCTAILCGEEAVPDSEEELNETNETPVDAIDLDALANLGPPLSNCVNILRSTYDQIQNVKVHRQKCQDIYDRSLRLLREVQELESKAPDIVHDTEGIIMDLHSKTKEWGSLHPLKSFLQQEKIKQDIERLRVEVDGALMRVGVLRNTAEQLKFKAARDRDKPVIRESEGVQADTVGEGADVLTQSSSVHSMPPLSPINMSAPETPMLYTRPYLPLRLLVRRPCGPCLYPPPLPVKEEKEPLSGKEHVGFGYSRDRVPTSGAEDTAIGPRSFNDVYRDDLMSNPCPSLISFAMSHHRTSARLTPYPIHPTPFLGPDVSHFETFWSPTHSTTVKPFEGNSTMWNSHPKAGVQKDDSPFGFVKPWMNPNRSGVDISNNNKALSHLDRMKLLHGVASGMKHLHGRGGVGNADLRSANISIKGSVARVSDFRMSEILEEDGETNLWRQTGSPAFIAPEAISEARGPVPAQTDVWRFGALFLAIVDLQSKKSHMRPLEDKMCGALSDDHRKLCQALHLDLRDLGVALTLPEGENYGVLAPSDHVTHIARHPRQNHTNGAFAMHNKTMARVKHPVRNNSIVENLELVQDFRRLNLVSVSSISSGMARERRKISYYSTSGPAAIISRSNSTESTRQMLSKNETFDIKFIPSGHGNYSLTETANIEKRCDGNRLTSLAQALNAFRSPAISDNLGRQMSPELMDRVKEDTRNTPLG